MCDSDSSCDEIDTAPPCPYGIHCMKPLCVYSHPHARNNPLSIYQTASQPMPFSHQSYSNSYATYPQTPPWNPSSTNSQPHGYGQPSGVWPVPSSMSGLPPPIPNQGQYSTISQPTGYGQPSGVWPAPSPMSGPPTRIPNQGQSSTITSTRPMHKAPANSNFSQTMPIQQPSYVKLPELPKKSVASQHLNGGRSDTGSPRFTNNTMIEERVPPAQVQTIAPYPVEGPINMPQPRRPATNPIANNNVMQMPQPRRPATNPIPINKIYQP
uniref:Uncharacterized protein n=1 Tax=Acrobeloides nanus TaxID=290746 RepID=A0A914DTH0_9BILA